MLIDLVKQISVYITLPTLVVYGLITGWVFVRIIKLKDEILKLKSEEISFHKEREKQVKDEKDAIVKLKDEQINLLKDSLHHLQSVKDDQKTGFEIIKELHSEKVEKAQCDLEGALNNLKRRQVELSELRNIKAKYDTLIKEIEHKEKLSFDFFSAITHEILAPANAIYGRAENLKTYFANFSEDKRKQYLDDIISEVKVIDFLIRNLRQVQAKEHISYETRPCYVYDTVKPIVKTLLPFARSKGVKIFFEKTRSLGKILADRGKLETAMYNLVVNAVEYSYPDSVVEISGFESDTLMTIEVGNTGICIEDGERELIFSKYYRGRHSRKVKASGLGMGLFIAKEIIKGHSGSIEFLSEPAEKGNRTKFKLVLPKSAV